METIYAESLMKALTILGVAVSSLAMTRAKMGAERRVTLLALALLGIVLIFANAAIARESYSIAPSAAYAGAVALIVAKKRPGPATSGGNRRATLPPLQHAPAGLETLSPARRALIGNLAVPALRAMGVPPPPTGVRSPVVSMSGTSRPPQRVRSPGATVVGRR